MLVCSKPEQEHRVEDASYLTMTGKQREKDSTTYLTISHVMTCLHLKLELIWYFLLLRGNTVNRGSTEGLICEFVGKGQRIHNPKINLQHMRLLTGMLCVQTRVGSLDFFAYMQLPWFSSNFLYFWYINQKEGYWETQPSRNRTNITASYPLFQLSKLRQQQQQQ